MDGVRSVLIGRGKRASGSLGGKGATAYVVAISPSDRWSVAIGHQKMKVWKDRDPKQGIELEHFGLAKFSPDEKLLACRNDDDGVSLLEVGTWKRTALFRDARIRTAAGCIAFAPDGKRLAWSDVTSFNNRVPVNSIFIWNVEEGKEVQRVQAHKEWIVWLGYSPDGKCIGSVSRDGTAKIWDAKTFKELAVTPVDPGPLVTAAFSPDSKTLAVATAELRNDHQYLMLRDVPALTLRGRLKTPDCPVCLQYSADGKSLAAALGHQAVLLDPQTGEIKAKFPAPKDSNIRTLALTKDGKELITGGHDGVRLWKVPEK